MRKKDIQIGQYVTCKRAVEAYYSGYHGTPKCVFTPGMIGVVAQIDVPYPMKNKTFCCVDFENEDGRWRVALDYDNITRP